MALDTPRTLEQVLREHSADGATPSFDRTELPLALLAGPDGVLASRAEARRVAARLAQFESADLDFAGIAELGHGFADELLRVMVTEQPALQLRPLNLQGAAAAMWDSVQRPPRG